MVKQFIADEAQRQQIQTDIQDWPTIFPTRSMIPQQPHRLPHQHPDLARHIDCGLYAWISTLLILNGHPLSILTPSVVHHFLLQTPTTFDVNTILGQVRHRRPTAATITGNSLGTMTVTQMNPGHAQQHPDPKPANNRVASLRPRQKPSVNVPMPLLDRKSTRLNSSHT